jgi:hypothetical protein
MIDHGNEIVRVGRGTPEWEEAFRDWGEWHHPLTGESRQWHDHLTGERRPLFEYPGWHFLSFRDAIIEYAEERIWEWLKEGLDDASAEELQEGHLDAIEQHMDISDWWLMPDEAVDSALGCLPA